MIRPVKTSECRRDPRIDRFFGWSVLPVDQACIVSACDTEHYSRALVPVENVAWRSPDEIIESYDGTGEVAAVVREVRHDDR